jgi:prefoldin subunit 5
VPGAGTASEHATSAPAASSHHRRNRRLGLAAQVAGVVGIVVCLALAAGVLMGRGWATDTVSTVSATIDAKLAKAVPVLDTASSKVSEIAGRVGAVADAANALADRPAPSSELLQGLMGAVTSVSDRYLELRATYGDLKESVTGALNGLQTLERLIPGFSIPQGPIDALAKLDAAVTDMDAKIMGLTSAIPASGPVDMVATAIATKVTEVQTKLQDLSGVITDAQTKLQDLQTQLASAESSINTAISLGSIGLILVLLWVAVLHWLLFRTGRQMRRETAGS